MIGIINYGMGNLASVQNALEFLGLQSEIFTDSSDCDRFDKLILPGVGAFGKAMESLNASNFTDAIKAQIMKGKPLLGICLGMQLLFESSTEFGFHEGLGLLKGKVKSFSDDNFNLPVPHMGWNDIIISKQSVLLSDHQNHQQNYYFVHSFYCEADDESTVSGVTEYGIRFHSVVEKDNIFGCQFHPEKSQRDGLQLLRNFGQYNA